MNGVGVRIRKTAKHCFLIERQIHEHLVFKKSPAALLCRTRFARPPRYAVVENSPSHKKDQKKFLKTCESCPPDLRSSLNDAVHELKDEFQRIGKVLSLRHLRIPANVDEWEYLQICRYEPYHLSKLYNEGNCSEEIKAALAYISPATPYGGDKEAKLYRRGKEDGQTGRWHRSMDNGLLPSLPPRTTVEHVVGPAASTQHAEVPHVPQ